MEWYTFVAIFLIQWVFDVLNLFSGNPKVISLSIANTTRSPFLVQWTKRCQQSTAQNSTLTFSMNWLSCPSIYYTCKHLLHCFMECLILICTPIGSNSILFSSSPLAFPLLQFIPIFDPLLWHPLLPVQSNQKSSHPHVHLLEHALKIRMLIFCFAIRLMQVKKIINILLCYGS